jgi:hypothetical protein
MPEQAQADEHSLFHPPHECFLQEGREPRRSGDALVHVLQFLPRTSDVTCHSRNGSWDCGSVWSLEEWVGLLEQESTGATAGNNFLKSNFPEILEQMVAGEIEGYVGYRHLYAQWCTNNSAVPELRPMFSILNVSPNGTCP